jgi:hypothetical protein
MSPGYRITLDVVTELDPEAVRHIVQTGLLEITRLLVTPPRNASPAPSTEVEMGLLDWRVVERPAESDQ